MDRLLTVREVAALVTVGRSSGGSISILQLACRSATRWPSCSGGAGGSSSSGRSPCPRPGPRTRGRFLRAATDAGYPGSRRGREEHGDDRLGPLRRPSRRIPEFLRTGRHPNARTLSRWSNPAQGPVGDPSVEYNQSEAQDRSRVSGRTSANDVCHYGGCEPSSATVAAVHLRRSVEASTHCGRREGPAMEARRVASGSSASRGPR
jgi:hypothetical protein